MSMKLPMYAARNSRIHLSFSLMTATRICNYRLGFCRFFNVPADGSTI